MPHGTVILSFFSVMPFFGKIVVKKVARFRCMVCNRSGNWGERSRFLKHTCAGYVETPLQAMRRLRLEKSAQKCIADSPLPPANLAEKCLVFSDMVGAMNRHGKCFHGDRILTCRALANMQSPCFFRYS
jgi:hypothetical protein